MPHRRPLLDLLARYRPRDADEAEQTARIVRFVEATPECFHRSHLAGHVTASTWIVSVDRSHVLLNHHKKLAMWMQFGGHCDGDPDVLAVAQRENEEEVGLASLRLVDSSPYDVGVRYVPPYRQVAEHWHYAKRRSRAESSATSASASRVTKYQAASPSMQ